MFWPEEFIINELADELKKRNHKVTVYTGLPNYPKGNYFNGYGFWKGPWKENKNGFDIVRVPLVPRKKGFFFLAINYISFVFFSVLNLPRIMHKKYDVIFVYEPSPIFVAIPAVVLRFFKKTPHVLWVQDLWPESMSDVGAVKKNGVIFKLIAQIVKWIYRNTDIILIQSPSFKENVLQYLSRPKRIDYIPNWCVNVKSKSEEQKSSIDWINQLPNGFKICFAGNVGKAQSVNTIVDAAEKLKQYPDIWFIIVGDGSELESLKQKAQQKQISNIVFTGRKPSTDMPNLFQVCDGLLVTLSKSEIFARTIPYKVQNYMASGVPLLGAVDGIVGQIITESNAGFSGPSEDSQALADNILKLYKLNAADRQNLGKNGKEYFLKNFEKNKVISNLENILHQAEYFG